MPATWGRPTRVVGPLPVRRPGLRHRRIPGQAAGHVGPAYSGRCHPNRV